MVERQKLVDKQKLHYEGVFIVRELYETIDKFMRQHGYNRNDISSKESVSKDKRNIHMKYEIWKQMCEYAKSVIGVDMYLEDIKDLDVKKEATKKNMNQGKVTIIFDAILENDFEHKWENKPGFFFVRVLFDKFIFKPFTTDYEGHVMKDYKSFLNEIRANLNLYKY